MENINNPTNNNEDKKKKIENREDKTSKYTDRDNEDKKEIEVIINACLICGIDMGSCNPRQLCGKVRCYKNYE